MLLGSETTSPFLFTNDVRKLSKMSGKTIYLILIHAFSNNCVVLGNTYKENNSIGMNAYLEFKNSRFRYMTFKYIEIYKVAVLCKESMHKNVWLHF